LKTNSEKYVLKLLMLHFRLVVRGNRGSNKMQWNKIEFFLREESRATTELK